MSAPAAELRVTLSYAAISVVVLVSVASIIGWFFQIEFLVRPSGDSAVMQLYTALCSLLGGVGLAAASLQRKRLAWGSALLITAYTVYATIANLAGAASNWFDRLAVDPFVSDTVTEAGRSSTLSSLSLLAIAMVVVVLTNGHRLVRTIAGTLLAALAASGAAVVLTGYVSSILFDYGWGATTGMGATTAVAVALLAASAGMRSWSGAVEISSQSGRKVHPFSVVASTGSVLIGIIFSISHELHEAELVRERTVANVTALTRQLESEFDSLEQQTARMASRIDLSESNPKEAWRADARNYIRDINGLQAIGRLERDGTYEFITARGFSVDKDKLINLAREGEGSEWRVHGTESGSGESRIVLVTPAGAFTQRLIMILDTASYLQGSLAPRFWEEFSLTISHNGETVFEHAALDKINVTGFEAESGVRLANSRWNIHVVPTVETVARQRSHLAEAILMSAFMVGTLLAFSIQMGMRARVTASEMRAKNEDLKDSRDSFKIVFESAPEGLLLVDGAGRIVLVNSGCDVLFGYANEELVGRSVEDLVPDSVRPRHREIREEYQSNPGPRAMGEGKELYGRRKDGSEVPVEIALSPCNYHGKPHVLAAIRDVSARREAEAAVNRANAELRAREAHLTSLISVIPDAVVETNDAGEIEDVNPATLDLFQRTREELIGEPVDALFPAEVVRALDVDRRKTGGLDFLKGATMSIDAQRKDGTEFRAALTVNAFAADDGSRFLWIIKDISTALRYEFERRSLTRALEEKNKELESIVYTASHDLRSPLVNLHGFSDELKRSFNELKRIAESASIPEVEREALSKVLDRDIPESLGFIQASTRRMDQLIKGLLKISRIGRVELQLKRLDMNELLKGVLDAMQFQIEGAEAEVEVEDLPPCVGDWDQLSQVFSNLVDNAVKYADPARKLHLRIYGRGKSRDSIYYVEDNGRGIAMDHRQKVFDVFHRLDPGDGQKGEGLGLAIIRRIVERHNGSVEAHANEPHGARFVVTLPAPRQFDVIEKTKRVFHAGTHD